MHEFSEKMRHELGMGLFSENSGTAVPVVGGAGRKMKNTKKSFEATKSWKNKKKSKNTAPIQYQNRKEEITRVCKC